MQLHGFARNSDWALVAATDGAGNPGVTLVLTDNDYTRSMWPAAFKASSVELLAGLSVGGWPGGCGRRSSFAALCMSGWLGWSPAGWCSKRARVSWPLPSRDPTCLLTPSRSPPDSRPSPLQAEYTVRLEGEVLHTRLAVTNTGDQAFDFTASLHRWVGGRLPRVGRGCGHSVGPPLWLRRLATQAGGQFSAG